MPAISRAVYTDLLTRVYANMGEEVCGMLIRGQHRKMSNVHPTPWCAFEFDDREQLLGFEEWSGVGDLIVYHSHPTGRAFPSNTDAMIAALNPRIYHLILSVRYRGHFLYRVDADGIVQEDLVIV